MAKPDSPQKHSKFLLLFALFWSVLVLLFDGLVGYGLLNQIRSNRFVTTEGRILHSAISENHGDDSTTYGADIRYEFHVAGRRYESDRVRYAAMSSSDDTWAQATVQDNPVGAIRTVYYDQNDPSRSVLQTGVGGQNWFMMLFLTPFNVVMVFLWGLYVMSGRPSPPAGGAQILVEGERVLVKMNKTSRIGRAMFTFALVPFLGVFVLAFTTGFSADVEWPVTILGIAFLAALWAGRKPKSGIKPDLIIDPVRGRLELTSGGIDQATNWKAWQEWKKSGKPALIIPIETLQGVVVRERVNETSDGKSTSYVVTLLTINAADAERPAEYDLGSWMLLIRAESFADWLRGTLALPEKADSR